VPGAETQAGFFRERFAGLLREKQNLPLGRINIRAFCSEIPGYDYSTLRRMIMGDIRLQPEAIELMADALGVPPETFFEYQVYQIAAALSAHPELCPSVYDTVLTRAAALDMSKGDGGALETVRKPGGRHFLDQDHAMEELKRS
jgi:hypothetical protein